MSYLEKVSEKRDEQQEQKHKQAALDAFERLSKDIRDLLSSLEKTGAKTLEKDFVGAVKALEKITKSLKEVKVTSDDEIRKALQALVFVLNNLDIKPTVNVAAPKVTVNERDIDFKPLIKEINRPVVGGILDDYFAQDIVTTDPNTQYIGFVNPKGNWYILESNELSASLRFTFGKSGYSQAIKKPTKHAYKLFNEALNEVQA